MRTSGKDMPAWYMSLSTGKMLYTRKSLILLLSPLSETVEVQSPNWSTWLYIYGSHYFAGSKSEHSGVTDGMC